MHDFTMPVLRVVSSSILCVYILLSTLALISHYSTTNKSTQPIPQKCETHTVENNLIHTVENNSSRENVIEVNLEDMMKEPATLNQDHPKLIRIIREKYLTPPSKENYNLYNPLIDHSMGQSKAVKEILGKDLENGFFVEYGGLDGETRSNSLVFERFSNWSGIVIEADPLNFIALMQKNRKSWTSGVCLSTKPYPNQVYFEQGTNMAKISTTKIGADKRPKNAVLVQCLPLYSILLALNRTTVDYFSLDVEGKELEVLKTIPWDIVNIKVLSVEFVHTKEGKPALKNYMESQGYWTYTEVIAKYGLANDFIFVKKDFRTPTDVGVM